MKVLEIVFTEKEKKIYKFFLDNTEEEIKEKLEEIKKEENDPNTKVDLQFLIDWHIAELKKHNLDIEHINKTEQEIESINIREAEEWEL